MSPKYPWLPIVLAFAFIASCLAEKPIRHCSCHQCQMRADVRAGSPHTISPLAVHSYHGPYRGHYIGGSAAIGGEARRPTEGTWGWDYTGLLFAKRVFLNWRHVTSRRHKTDTYRTDGPHLKRHR